jgi:hypothetical protein
LTSGGQNKVFTESNNCGKSLAQGANCTISVLFKPQAAKRYSVNVEITDSVSPKEPQQILLDGLGVK